MSPLLAVTGLDRLLATQSTGGMRYRREDVLVDHEFVDVVSEEAGMLRLDLRRFHDAVPIVAT